MAGKESSDAKESKSDGSDQKAPEDGSSRDTTASHEDLVAEKVQHLLNEHGIDASTLDTMGKQLLEELLSLQKEKPLVFLLGAFALGCVVGRSFK